MKNFGFTHKTGILLPISSLPSNYGIGGFGKSAYKFIDFLKETNQTCWQILPLNPTSYGDSPYQSPSSLAGNPYFIDLDLLYQDKLLTKDELKENINKSKNVDYGWLFNTRFNVLRKAFNRFVKSDDYYEFLKRSDYWLNDYAKFMALKEKNNYKDWLNWDRLDVNEEDLEFWYFIQYLFDKQWNDVLKYAHDNGITIIGDMPIYVALDSVDVWMNKSDFLLDKDNYPTLVAGCPPDGFSPDGQLWGNPIYNWEKMKQDNFSWWIKRIKRHLELYDIIRIDHFRGFAGYYAIPYGDATARYGAWHSAPGKELFKRVNETFNDAKIIAEDLGFITPDVKELLEFTGYPGMKILQFAFYDEDAEFLPRMYKTSNCVVYTGSHDADCTYTWIKNIEGDAKKRFKKECLDKTTYKGVYAMIYLALSSTANLSIIPIQDYLCLTNEEGRMNTPSTASGNWTYRLSNRYNTNSLKEKIKTITIETSRN